MNSIMTNQNPHLNGNKALEQTPESDELTKKWWRRTLRDMQAIARDREDRGFESVVIPAGTTTPKPLASDETDEFGLSYIIPDNKTGPFLDVYERGTFTDTGVYQVTDKNHVFIVTECIDLSSKVVILIAGTYRMHHASSLVRAATNHEKMYSHIQTLNGTRLGSFEHDDVSAFFPCPEDFYI